MKEGMLPPGYHGGRPFVLTDSGLNISNVFDQQSLLLENAESWSRLSALCVAMAFIGGSVGSYLGPNLYQKRGWTITSMVGAGVFLFSMAVYVSMQRLYRC